MKNLTVLMFVFLLGASIASADVTFYTDESEFGSLYPGLTVEDYSNTIVPDSAAVSDSGPFDSFTNNDCFTPGAIVDGISLDNFNGGNNVVLTPPFLGVTSVSVGPNAFDHNGEFSFTDPINAFGVEIVMPMADGFVDIVVYGIWDTLDVSSSNGTLAGVFWGVYSDEDIYSISFIEPEPPTGELFANVRFGAVSALENSTWGSIKTAF